MRGWQGWLLLLIGACCEMLFVYCLRRYEQSQETRDLFSAIGCYGLSGLFIIQATKVVPAAIAYPVWVGLGTSFVVLLEIGKAFSPLRLMLVLLIFASVLGLKISSPPPPPQSNSRIVQPVLYREPRLRLSKVGAGAGMAVLIIMGIGSPLHRTPAPALKRINADRLCRIYSRERGEQVKQLRLLAHQQELPIDCPLKNQLLFGHAIESLASNNQKLEATIILCEIEYEFFEKRSENLYFRQWSKDPQFREWLEFYLKHNSCPAARWLL